MSVNLSFSWVFGKIFHSGFRYRDRAKIIGDILGSVNGDPRGKTKTGIMRSANLSLEQTNKYIELLLMCGVLKSVDPLKNQEIGRYKLTEKGFVLIKESQLWELMLETASRTAR
jgi:predicted transcriptional regulator